MGLLQALAVANDISQRVNFMDAASAGNHPTLSEIYREMSSEQRILCGKANWTFLNYNVDIDGFDVSTDTDTITAGWILFESIGLRTSPAAGKTEYYAQQITTGENLVKMINATINLKIGGQGAGAPSGTIALYICPDSDGSPDLTSPTMTADTLALASLSTNWTEHTFLFTGTDTVLLKNTNYWVVFKWVGAADNGDSMFVAVDPLTDTAATTLKTRLNNASTWTTQTGSQLSTTLTFYTAEYATELTLPTAITEVYAMYSGDNSDKDANLTPFSGDYYTYSGVDIPTDKFVLRKITNGALVIYINPSIECISWTIEARRAPVAITADTDTLIIPDDFIDWLIYQCAANFISRGLGTQDAQMLSAFQKRADEVKNDMEFRYLPKPQEGFRVVRSGQTMRGGRYTKDFVRRHYGPR